MTQVRNIYRRSPRNISDRAIQHELDGLDSLVAHGIANRGDLDRILDLADELTARYEATR